EHSTRFDLLIVGHQHALDGSADAGRNLRHVRIDLRIVGRLASGGCPDPDHDGDDDDGHDAGRQADAALLKERHALRLIGHQRKPPRYWRTASSASPSARASTAFETL